MSLLTNVLKLWRTGQYLLPADSGFIPRQLFDAGEQGAWYDPTDLRTLFQDSAGTTPVTAVEQPVGLMLDKSKGLVQDNGTAVMNMLSRSEYLQSSTPWVPSGTLIVTTTPAAITANTSTGYKAFQYNGLSLVSGTGYQLAVDFKANGYTKVYLTDLNSARIPATSFDLVALTATGAGTITDIGDGWRRCVLPFTAASTGAVTVSFVGYPDAGATLSAYGVQYTGDGVSGVLMRRPDLRLASNAAVEPLYQRTDAFMGLSVLYAGNHAGQATSTKRPKYSRRVNLLTKTEDINDAAWSKPGVSVIASGVLAPDGTMSAFTIKAAAGAGSKILWYLQSGPTSATPYTSVVWIRNRSVIPGGSYIRLVNTSLGVIAGSSRQFPAVASGWVQMSISGTHAGASGGGLRLDIGTDGNEEGEWDIWHPSLTLATDAHLPYQRVNTATDYDTVGFPDYAKFDGIDDNWVSAAGGGGNAGFFFSAAVTVMSDNGWRILFSDAGTNTGYMVRMNPSNQLELIAGNGSANTFIATTNSIAIGATDIVQAFDDGVNLNVKIGNGATASIARPVVAAGTAGFTMGQNNGVATGYFNGRVYSTVYRKDSATTQSQREAVATYQRTKAKMP